MIKPNASENLSIKPSQTQNKLAYVKGGAWVLALLSFASGVTYLIVNIADLEIRINRSGFKMGANNQGSAIGTDNQGNSVGTGNSGNVSKTDNQGNSVGSGNSGTNISSSTITVQGNFVIQSSDPKYQNTLLPGYRPQEGFTSGAEPPQLSNFQKGEFFTRDLRTLGNVNFNTSNVSIRNKVYETIFSLYGSEQEWRRATFNLNGQQKGILLQFGVSDIPSGSTNLNYKIRILINGEEKWSGDCIYGTEKQIVSVPLSASNATSLTIEYKIAIGNNQLPLTFTRAEIFYN
jgi:hypothetical protein